MSLHQEVDELIAAFALGAVEADEAALVRSHLPSCRECQETLTRMTEVVAVLPLSLEEVAPPPDLKARVLATVGGGASSAPAAPAAAPTQPGKLLFLRPVPAWAPLAAAAAMAAVMFGWNLVPRADRTPPAPTLQVALKDTSAHGTVGNVTYMGDQKLALVTFHALPAPPPNKSYELWVIPAGGAPVPAGVFSPEPDGSKVLVVNRAIGHGDTIAVTEEAPGGASRPTSLPIISGQL